MVKPFRIAHAPQHVPCSSTFLAATNLGRRANHHLLKGRIGHTKAMIKGPVMAYSALRTRWKAVVECASIAPGRAVAAASGASRLPSQGKTLLVLRRLGGCWCAVDPSRFVGRPLTPHKWWRRHFLAAKLGPSTPRRPLQQAIPRCVISRLSRAPHHSSNGRICHARRGGIHGFATLTVRI